MKEGTASVGPLSGGGRARAWRAFGALRPRRWMHLAPWPGLAGAVSDTVALPADRRPAGGVLRMQGAAPAPGGAGSGPGRDGEGYHVPVLADEVVHFLRPGPGKVIVDATLGGGGHSERLLEAGAMVLAMDQDPEAIEHARVRLAAHADRLVILRANFRDLGRVLAEAGVERVDGILADVGVSSRQIDAAARGFSFGQEGPLDMRMDPAAPVTAADLVNGLEGPQLTDIFRRYGEERAARKIAGAIVKARRTGPIHTTSELAAIVERANPRRGARIHPATRVFQALRIAVNDELAALEELLRASVDHLRPGGRLAIISFHSLEDRIVKRFLAGRSRDTIDRPEWPAPRPNPDFAFRLVVRKPVEATPEETRRNPRARSARLRVAERV